MINDKIAALRDALLNFEAAHADLKQRMRDLVSSYEHSLDLPSSGEQAAPATPPTLPAPAGAATLQKAQDND
jgi:hypothetical protein